MNNDICQRVPGKLLFCLYSLVAGFEAVFTHCFEDLAGAGVKNPTRRPWNRPSGY
jgi:hypothetical protein